jgi:hypothetical protein
MLHTLFPGLALLALGLARTITFEDGLLAAPALFLLSGLAAAATARMCAGVDSSAVDRGRIMRVSIQAAALRLAGTFLAASADLFAFVWRAPKSRPSGALAAA